MHQHLDPLLVVQHGLVSRHQAWTTGLSARQIDHLIHRELLVPVHRGVYRDPAAPITLEQRALAATLAGRTGAVASHRLAVALHGVRNFDCQLTEISARGLCRVPNITAHRTVRVPDQMVLRRVPVTSPARTIIDTALVVSPGVVRRWLEAWLSNNVLQLDSLEQQLRAVKGHAGGPIVRQLLDDRTLLHGVADSGGEAALGHLLQRHDLPPLTLHHLVTMPNGAVYELDWSYPELRVGLELDGYGVHLRSLEAFEDDRYRRNELEIAGWTILNFTARQVERKPKTVVRQVRELLGSRTVIS